MVQKGVEHVVREVTGGGGGVTGGVGRRPHV